MNHRNHLSLNQTGLISTKTFSHNKKTDFLKFFFKQSFLFKYDGSLKATLNSNASTINCKETKNQIINFNYSLESFHRSNQDTCLVHKPAVFEGQWVQSGDLLADCSASVGGELSLGQNLLIAYMPWEGYNFEDAILISERLVYDDLYTSIHIEKYEMEIKETKLGIEQLTREIPEIPHQQLENLDSSGLIKIGSWVQEGDILVGKVTPVNKKAQSPYQKLLYTILEKQFLAIRDSSLRAPKGIKAKVIGMQIFKKENSSSFANAKKNSKKLQKKVENLSKVKFNTKKDKLIQQSLQTIHQTKKNLASTSSNFNYAVKKNDLFFDSKGLIKSTKSNPLNNDLDQTNKTNGRHKNHSFIYEMNQIKPFKRSIQTQFGQIHKNEHHFNLRKMYFLKKLQKYMFMQSKKTTSANSVLKFPSNLNSKINSSQLKKMLTSICLKTSHIVEFAKKTKKTIRFRNLYFKKISKTKPLDPGFISSIHIFLAEKRRVQVGDKMAGRHGNKGIVSQILPREDMPYLPDGTPLDMVLNPLGVPSRMNVGQIYECLLGFAGKYLGEHFKVFPFDEMYGPEASRSFVYSKLYEARMKTGLDWLYNPNNPGKIRLYDGRTGESFDQAITVGDSYILRLVHMVDDKIHARSTGPYSLVTQQPLRGRSKQGGQRLGEMEVWALEGYGAAFTLLEMLTIKSDDMTGRMTLWSNLILNKDISIGTPESFKVLVCELQALCLDIGLFRSNPVNKVALTEIDSLMNLP